MYQTDRPWVWTKTSGNQWSVQKEDNPPLYDHITVESLRQSYLEYESMWLYQQTQNPQSAIAAIQNQHRFRP